MKAAVLIKRLLGVSVVTKSQSGFLIALVAAFTIVGEVAFTGIDFLSRNDALVRMGVGLLGFVGWLTGRVREARRAESSPLRNAPAREAVAENPLAFLGSLKAWGVILVLLAGSLSCLAVWRQQTPAPVVRARSLPAIAITVTNVVTNVVTITNEAPRLVFPSLKLQGVVLNGAKSSAVINGRVLHLGEGLRNVVLVAVDSEHAVVAMEAQTNVLTLRK
jgi:hypothetical protein